MKNDDESGLQEMSDGDRDDLRASFPPAAFPEERIERRIRRSVEGTGPSTLEVTVPSKEPTIAGWRVFLAPVLATAAAVVLFIGGVEYGRRLGAASASVQPTADAYAEALRAAVVAQGRPAGSTLSLEIQSAGSQYVAALARFSEESSSLSEDDRRMAREVAMAVMYGASLQLIREGGEQEVLRSVANMVATERAGGAVPVSSPPPGL